MARDRNAEFERIIEMVATGTMYLELNMEEAHVVLRSLKWWQAAADRKRRRIIEELGDKDFATLNSTQQADMENAQCHIPLKLAVVDNLIVRMGGGGDDAPTSEA